MIYLLFIFCEDIPARIEFWKHVKIDLFPIMQKKKQKKKTNKKTKKQNKQLDSKS